MPAMKALKVASMAKKKIVFTGGGTVGHVTLNLLLIPRFLKDGWEVHYIGDKNGIEHTEIKKSGLEVTFHGVATGKLRRYFSFQNMLDLFKVAFGLLQSLLILLKLRPQVLFSKGGFVSVPPVMAARILGIPVFVHESDLSMGLANRIAYKFATMMYTTFEQSSELRKIKHIGAVTKVTQGAINQNPDLKEIEGHFDPQLKTLLFIGGSGGAKVFNEFISQTPELVETYNVINITGDKTLNQLTDRLYRVDYVTDLYQPLMDLADVVVTRGGSNTLFELVALQKLHLIIPLGKEASRGDQLENAAYFVKKGYAQELLESDFNFDRFQSKLTELLENQSRYQGAMKASNEIKSPDEFYRLLIDDIAAQKG